jgi:hypothetical protein
MMQQICNHDEYAFIYLSFFGKEYQEPNRYV